MMESQRPIAALRWCVFFKWKFEMFIVKWSTSMVMYKNCHAVFCCDSGLGTFSLNMDSMGA